MFDLTSSKLFLLAIVALLVIGPKDFPILLRTIGKYVGIIRGHAKEFRAQFDEAIRESELAQLKKEMEGIGREAEATLSATKQSVEQTFAEARQSVEATVADTPAPGQPAVADQGALAATPGAAAETGDNPAAAAPSAASAEAPSPPPAGQAKTAAAPTVGHPGA